MDASWAIFLGAASGTDFDVRFSSSSVFCACLSAPAAGKQLPVVRVGKSSHRGRLCIQVSGVSGGLRYTTRRF